MKRYRVYLANGQYIAMCELNDELIYQIGAYPTGKTGKAMRLIPAFPTLTTKVIRGETMWSLAIYIDGQFEEFKTFDRAHEAYLAQNEMLRQKHNI